MVFIISRGNAGREGGERTFVSEGIKSLSQVMEKMVMEDRHELMVEVL